MFNLSNISVQRGSTAVDAISLDFINKECDVLYKNGTAYNYGNVSRRAMINLLLNKNISLGFWVNDNLLGYVSNVSVMKFC